MVRVYCSLARVAAADLSPPSPTESKLRQLPLELWREVLANFRLPKHTLLSIKDKQLATSSRYADLAFCPCQLDLR